MTLRLITHFVLPTACGLLLASCKPQAGTAATPVSAPVTSSAPSTDIAGLSQLVTLPVPPLAATWQSTRVGDDNFGPSDLQLLAVLRFSPQNADKVVALARKREAPRKGELEVQPWFPVALKQNAKRGAQGQLVVRGQRLNADDFAHLSLRNGFAFRVEGTNVIVLSLFST